MLVTIEGIDGSGKTTVWKALEGADKSKNTKLWETLHDSYSDATFTREPTDSWYGEAVARSIGDPDADPLAELFLYTADHADHLSRVVEPALADGDLVISDRYVDSRYAYQGATLEGHLDRPMEYVQGIHRAFTIEPDLTIYLDLDPETAAARAGATDKFERAAYLADVRENYRRLLEAEPERFVEVDASRSPEEVLDSVEHVLADVLED